MLWLSRIFQGLEDFVPRFGKIDLNIFQGLETTCVEERTGAGFVALLPLSARRLLNRDHEEGLCSGAGNGYFREGVRGGDSALIHTEALR